MNNDKLLTRFASYCSDASRERVCPPATLTPWIGPKRASTLTVSTDTHPGRYVLKSYALPIACIRMLPAPVLMPNARHAYNTLLTILPPDCAPSATTSRHIHDVVWKLGKESHAGMLALPSTDPASGYPLRPETAAKLRDDILVWRDKAMNTRVRLDNRGVALVNYAGSCGMLHLLSTALRACYPEQIESVAAATNAYDEAASLYHTIVDGEPLPASFPDRDKATQIAATLPAMLAFQENRDIVCDMRLAFTRGATDPLLGSLT